jgi:hypothetical protein
MKPQIFLAVVCLALGVQSLESADLAISAGANICLFRQKEVRDAYGSGFPVGIQAWAGGKNWRISVGLEYLSDNGRAFPLGGGTDEFPLKLTVTSIPVALYYQAWIQDVFLAAGGGVSYSRFKEEWEGLDIVVKGQKWGPYLVLMGGYRANPRWSVFGNVCYDPIPTGKSSLLVPEVKLGGLKIGAGVMFYL